MMAGPIIIVVVTIRERSNKDNRHQMADHGDDGVANIIFW